MGYDSATITNLPPIRAQRKTNLLQVRAPGNAGRLRCGAVVPGGGQRIIAYHLGTGLRTAVVLALPVAVLHHAESLRELHMPRPSTGRRVPPSREEGSAMAHSSKCLSKRPHLRLVVDSHYSSTAHDLDLPVRADRLLIGMVWLMLPRGAVYSA